MSGSHVKLSSSAFGMQPWLIHDVATDFRLLDVWALPTPGGPDDFPRLVELMTSFDPSKISSPATRFLFVIREHLGRVLGWDRPEAGIGSRVSSLRSRVPADVRNAEVPDFSALPAIPLYQAKDEFAAEVANRTVHGVLHLGWVEDEAGYRGQMAILVRPAGLLGRAYLAAIMPFRHLIVYPALMREIEEKWRSVNVG